MSDVLTRLRHWLRSFLPKRVTRITISQRVYINDREVTGDEAKVVLDMCESLIKDIDAAFKKAFGA